MLFEPMIACDRPNCEVEWYHYACARVKNTRAPKRSQICQLCLVEYVLKDALRNSFFSQSLTKSLD